MLVPPHGSDFEAENPGRAAAPGAAAVPTLVVYPGRAGERERLSAVLQARVYRFGAAMSLRGVPAVGLLPASPEEIDVVERVARAIRWVVLDARFSTFPVQLDVPPALRDVLAGVASIRADGSGTRCVLVRRLTEAEWEILTRAVDRAVQAARAQGRRGKGDVQALEVFSTDLENADAAVARLQACPVCGGQGERASGFTAAGACFSCACSGCGTGWGTRDCAACGERFPFLAPTLPQGAPPVAQGPEWLDQVYGADVLAEPCRTCAAAGVYICPRCGQCGRGHD